MGQMLNFIFEGILRGFLKQPEHLINAKNTQLYKLQMLNPPKNLIQHFKQIISSDHRLSAELAANVP